VMMSIGTVKSEEGTTKKAPGVSGGLGFAILSVTPSCLRAPSRPWSPGGQSSG
jgi:hypothetical protein